MAPPKGFKPSPASAVGKGRPKGASNKTTLAAREMFQRAADGLGGLPALIAWGKEEPGEFWRLYARLIPVEHTGAGGTGPVVTAVRFIYESTPDPPR